MAKNTPIPQAPSPLVYLSSQYIRATQYLQAIIASTTDAIVTTDMGGKVIYFSPGAERMVRRTAKEVLGLPVHRFYEGGREEAERIMRALLKDGALANHETTLLAEGRRVHVSISISLLRDARGRLLGTLGISKDIGERVALERRLRELSITDNLTGLFNQRHFLERASAEVQRARRLRSRLSLVLMDLDDFKGANDRWGHLEGDRVLLRVGAAILGSIRRQVDAAFRYGGDEFVLLLPGLALRRAESVARRVETAVSSHDGPVRVTLSWGAGRLGPSDDLEHLMARADARMYAAKRAKQRMGGARPVPAGRYSPPLAAAVR